MTVVNGTSRDEDLIGTAGNDQVFGLGGRDRIYALAGADLLYGGLGNDLLDGGAGADTMYGGEGDDIYRVDNPGDIVSEEGNSGVDAGGTEYVQTVISYRLPRFVERLEMQGTSDIDGAGNELANTLKGNTGNNVLTGFAGSDTLYGQAGDDILIGGVDKDYLFGGTGADIFVMNLNMGAADKINDWESVDRIGIYAKEFNLVEGNGLTGGALSPAWFTTGSAATSVGHGQFVYDAASLSLKWDADGAGGAAAATLAIFNAGASLSASQFRVFTDLPTVSATAFADWALSEDSGKAWVNFELSQPWNHDVTLTYSTVNGTAFGGSDFGAISGGHITVAAGTTSVNVAIDLLNDNYVEPQESFSVRIDSAVMAGTGEALAVQRGPATIDIVDEGPSVAAIHDVYDLGIPDPAGIVWDPASDTIFLSDSEIEEYDPPSATNLYAFDRDGNLKGSYNLPFTVEPTGLAIDPINDLMFISDDDYIGQHGHFNMYVVRPSNPTSVVYSFDVFALGADDPEDVACDPASGELFIVNGVVNGSSKITVTDETGRTLIDTIQLPSEIPDAEAIAYNPAHDTFFVGGGFSDKIWEVDRTGAIVDRIDVLQGARNPENNHRVYVKDIALGPSSDGSGGTSLYVADYGWDHFGLDRTVHGYMDGRWVEIDPGDWQQDPLLAAATPHEQLIA